MQKGRIWSGTNGTIIIIAVVAVIIIATVGAVNAIAIVVTAASNASTAKWSCCWRSNGIIAMQSWAGYICPMIIMWMWSCGIMIISCSATAQKTMSRTIVLIFKSTIREEKWWCRQKRRQWKLGHGGRWSAHEGCVWTTAGGRWSSNGSRQRRMTLIIIAWWPHCWMNTGLQWTAGLATSVLRSCKRNRQKFD